MTSDISGRGQTDHDLAEINIARLRAPLDDPLVQDFVDGLDQINGLADDSPGFRWRLKDEDGDDATSIQAFDDELMLINMSTWESIEALHTFVFKTAHSQFLRRRRDWFALMGEVYVALWWVPTGHEPTEAEGIERLEQLRESGPTNHAFTFKDPFAPFDPTGRT